MGNQLTANVQFHKYKGNKVVAVLMRVASHVVEDIQRRAQQFNLEYTADASGKPTAEQFLCVDIEEPTKAIFALKGQLTAETRSRPQMSGDFAVYFWRVVQLWTYLASGIQRGAEWQTINGIMLELEKQKNLQESKQLTLNKKGYTCNVAIKLMAQMLHNIGFIGPSLALGGRVHEDKTGITLIVAHPLPIFASLAAYDEAGGVPKDVRDWAKNSKVLWKLNADASLILEQGLKLPQNAELSVHDAFGKMFLLAKESYKHYDTEAREQMKQVTKPVMMFANGKRLPQVCTTDDFDFMCNNFDVQYMPIYTGDSTTVNRLAPEYISLHAVQDFAAYMGNETYGGAKGSMYRGYYDDELGTSVSLGDLYLTAMQLKRLGEDVLHMTYTGTERKDLLLAFDKGITLAAAKQQSRRSISTIIEDDDAPTAPMKPEELFMQKVRAYKLPPYGCALISHINITFDSSYSDELLRQNPALLQQMKIRVQNIVNQLPNCSFTMI